MFDSRRFGLLFRAHWAENRRAYAWFLGAGVLLHLLVSVASFAGTRGFEAFRTEGQEFFYYLGLFVLSIIFAGRYFIAMSSRAPALLSLMRPASVFEKWLLAFVFIALLYPLAYSLAFCLVNVPDWLVAHAQAQQHAAQEALEFARNPGSRERPDAFDPDAYRLFLPVYMLADWREALSLVLFLWSAQALAAFGSLYFRTVPFIKTLLAALAIMLAIGLLSDLFGGSPDLAIGFWTSTRPLSDGQEWLFGTVWLLFPALLWLACYLALREREIAA